MIAEFVLIHCEFFLHEIPQGHLYPTPTHRSALFSYHNTQGNLFNTLQNHLSFLRRDKNKVMAEGYMIVHGNKRTLNLIIISSLGV